jgi:cytochrome c-type biogenesis protein
LQAATLDVSVAGAFLAGLVSFLSPCVLPLVPGYISMLSGIGVEQLRQGQQPRTSLLTSSLAFVVGFSLVFVAFGASASAVGQFLKQNKTFLAPLAGALIVLFGLHLLGLLAKVSVRNGLMAGAALLAAAVLVWLRPGLAARVTPVQLFSLSLIGFLGPLMTRWLNRDVHFRTLGGQPGLWGSFLMGFAFAFGWTPCIGPILTTVLALAAASDTIARGVFLLAIYSAGLAIPFLLTALGIGQFLRFYQRFRKHLHAVEVGSGALLLVVGGLVFANRLTWLSGKLSFLNRFVW